MGLPRITPWQDEEVTRLRKAGRTNSQIEKAVGIASGVLSGRYVVGDDARPHMDRARAGSLWIYPPTPKDSRV